MSVQKCRSLVNPDLQETMMDPSFGLSFVIHFEKWNIGDLNKPKINGNDQITFHSIGFQIKVYSDSYLIKVKVFVSHTHCRVGEGSET